MSKKSNSSSQTRGIPKNIPSPSKGEVKGKVPTMENPPPPPPKKSND